ncbi:MAG: coenzyme F420-0:L-glutamate ligase [Candidatus Dojkabacteria bacterium]|nr:MAG: coenzyme F420-0:L-glutamate ligase [Candidatus Dojkabacteria bacterium]
MNLPKPNKGKPLFLEIEGRKVYRYPIKTQIILSGDNLYEIVAKAVQPFLKEFDKGRLFVGVTEKAVASSQGRGFPISEIKPGRLANFLTKYVHKSKFGIGLGSPETMQIAIQEAGALRIIFASAVAAVTKLFGIKGMFYRLAGNVVRSIDGPVAYALPPFNTYAVLGAKDGDKVAAKLSQMLKVPTFIADSNDIGVNIIGSSSIEKNELSIIKLAYQDNFWGNTDEQTPVAIIYWQD